jgi:hypothetical protein
MKTIPLTQGKVAKVDDEDFERLAQSRWYAGRYKHLWYAQREVRFPDGRRTTIKMHREILGLAPRAQADHEDGDGLNNQRGNIRPASALQNGANKRIRPNRRFKGVYFRKEYSKWRAAIRVNWKLIHLGEFSDPRHAALAYDAAAKVHFGEFACLNFP